MNFLLYKHTALRLDWNREGAESRHSFQENWALPSNYKLWPFNDNLLSIQ